MPIGTNTGCPRYLGAEKMMRIAFNHQQMKKLVAPLNPARIKKRNRDNKSFDYVEGWFAISEANAIFGYAGWDREMAQFERVFEAKEGGETICGYLARVRITVRAGGGIVVREGTGFGEAKSLVRAEAHELALKASETDATKRALATFGNRFGLALYDKDQNSAASPSATGEKSPPKHYVLYDEMGAILASALSAEGFCSGFRQLIEQSKASASLKQLLEENHAMLTRMRAERPSLRSGQGRHFADILERLAAKRLAAIVSQNDGQTHRPSELNGKADGEDFGAARPPQGNGHMALPQAVVDTEGGESQTKCPREVADQIPSAPQRDKQDDLHAVVLSPPTLPNSCAVDGSASQDGCMPLSQQTPLNKMVPISEAELAAPKPPARGLSAEAFDRDGRAAGLASATPGVCASATCADGLRPSKIGFGPMIDKSRLAVATTKRVRHKAHLLFVASQACLICGGNPCHAHHLTFAQPRGLSLKVSDEFTVPLCVIHHNALHSRGNERAFWRFHRIEPLPEAKKLWGQTISQSGQSS